MNATAYRVTKILQGSVVRVIAVITVMLIFGSPIAAVPVSQTGVRIVWMDDPDEVRVRDTAGNTIRAEFGLVLEGGATIQTGNTDVEIVLIPNGSVIVIADNTTFRIDRVPAAVRDNASNENVFSLVVGKMCMIAAKSSGSTYSVRTPTAVAGVRGTDFYRMYDPSTGSDWLCVTEGAVQLDSPKGTEGVLVPAGSFINLNNGFQTAQPDDAWLRKNPTLNTLHRAMP